MKLRMAIVVCMRRNEIESKFILIKKRFSYNIKILNYIKLYPLLQMHRRNLQMIILTTKIKDKEAMVSIILTRTKERKGEEGKGK